MQLEIRRAVAEDTPLIVPLFDAYRVFYHQKSDKEGASKFIENRLTHEQSVIFLALADNVAKGFVQLYPIFSSVSMKRAWLLNDLYVAEDNRGKGIGVALLEAAKNYARMTAAKWLMLQTHADNFSAQALYEKNGWQKETDLFYVYTL